MQEEHLACPKCEYDLHGIPEVRCPECGFRYDFAALRSLAASAEWTRLAAARTVIVRATIAGSLAAPSVCERLNLPAWAPLYVVAVGYVVAFFTWVVFTDAYRGIESIPNLFTLFMAVAVAIWVSGVLIVPVLRPVTLACGVIMLGLGWVVRLRDWPELPPRGNTQSPELRRSVVRHSVVGTSLLAGATLLVVVGLLG